jgi:putative FmdB family regulatory protein
MPIYSYECSDCRAELEDLEKLSSPAERPCEKCGGTMKRVMSLSNVNNLYTPNFSKRDNTEIKPPPPRKPIFPDMIGR